MSGDLTIRIATRASALAMWQARHVSALLVQKGVANVEIVEVSTVGDRDQTEPLSSLSTSIEGGATGVFTREVQRAVLDHRADVAVHSLKDLPTQAVEGLSLAGIPARAPRFDRLVFSANEKSSERDSRGRAGQAIAGLPLNAKIGTGALRRQAQLRHLRSDLQPADIRGNVETRLQKLDAGEFDAIMLASAGLARLGYEDWPTAELSPPLMWPAVGQAALGLECRSDDQATIAVLQDLTNPETLGEVLAERAMLRTLRAGCHAPVGAMTRCHGKVVHLEGIVLSADGDVRLIRSAAGRDAEAVGRRVAELLLDAGAEAYL